MAAPMFDVVEQFSQLREQLSSPAPMPQFPQAPDIEIPNFGGLSQPQHGPLLRHSGRHDLVQRGPAPKPGRLVPWKGKRFDSSVLPYFQRLSQAFPGLRVTSGYRDPDHNRRVNGAKNSWHLKGRAADFAGSAGDMQRAAAWARQNGAREVLVHNAGSGQHLHVAW